MSDSPKPKEKGSWYNDPTVGIIVSLLGSLGVGILFFYLADYHTHWLAPGTPFPSLKQKVCEAIATTLVATAVLYWFSQLPGIRREVDSYFIRAFTSTSYVETLKNDRKEEICHRLIQNLYGKVLPPDLLKSYIARLSSASAIPLIYDLDVDIGVTNNGDLSIQTTTRKFRLKNNRLVVRNIAHVLKETCPQFVRFKSADDVLTYEQITLWVEGKAHAWSNTEIKDIIKHSAITEKDGYCRMATIEWELLPRAKDIQLPTNGEVIVEIKEIVTVNKMDSTMLFRLRQNCLGLKVELKIDGAAPKDISGGLLAEGISFNDLKKTITPNSIRLEVQQKWLTQGSGYVLFISS